MADDERAVKPVEGEIIPRREAPPDRPRKRRPAPPPPRRGCWGTCALFGGLSLLVMTVVIGCMVLVTTLELVDFMRDPLDNFLEVFGFEENSEPKEVDSRTIVLGIHRMAILQTTTGDIEVIKTVVDTGAAPDAELKVSYIGYVTAGIDLALVTEESITTAPDGKVTIVLPPAQITGCYLGKPETLSRECTDIPLAQDCGKIIERLQDEAYDRAIDELRETATEMDLVTLAYQEAEARIYDLVKNLGHEQVNFQRGEQVLEPSATCFSD